ncbi:OLC1v1005223C1 [Oldenlandia corymbosa var. corymbosa]|uniref:OLC1v1005223C1 n=1 Tax=Oldenlandia corymbosa var. corymbosa TaxID=529605 RepID=A0AAV1DEP5_OLDCO|nr:OLC1v1005223C1 [Oldenlandia corymbosa var. corymbosa]
MEMHNGKARGSAKNRQLLPRPKCRKKAKVQKNHKDIVMYGAKDVVPVPQEEPLKVVHLEAPPSNKDSLVSTHGAAPAEPQEDKKTSKTFLTKMSPSTLLGFIKHMKENTPEQVEAMKEIGFGALLDLEIKTVPTQLFVFLANNFEPGSRKLTFPNGEKFKFEEEDVLVVLEDEYDAFVKEWKYRFDSKEAKT